MTVKTFKRKATIPFEIDLQDEQGTVLRFELPGTMSIAAMLKGRELAKLNPDTALEDVEGIFDFFRGLLTNTVVDKLLELGLGAEDLMEIVTWYQTQLEETKPKEAQNNPKQKATAKR